MFFFPRIHIHSPPSLSRDRFYGFFLSGREKNRRKSYNRKNATKKKAAEKRHLFHSPTPACLKPDFFPNFFHSKNCFRSLQSKNSTKCEKIGPKLFFQRAVFFPVKQRVYSFYFQGFHSFIFIHFRYVIFLDLMDSIGFQGFYWIPRILLDSKDSMGLFKNS